MLLDNLNLFLRIVEKGGMASAGRDLGLSPASVSDRLASLEKHYGARLLTRTTRSISLTDEGQELVIGARRILAEAEELQSRIKFGVERISGAIHIVAPHDLGQNRLVPMLDAFQRQNPEITIDLTLDDGYIDLAGRGIDLALRFGDLIDSTLRVRKIGDNQRFVCASPDYLKANGTPAHPDDLDAHNCILMRFGTQVDREWSFLIDGKERKCPVRGDRIVNNGALAKQWCLDGHGIALKSQWDVGEKIKTGALVPLLKNFMPPSTSLQMVYSSGAIQPRRVKLMMDHIAESFRNKDVKLN